MRMRLTKIDEYQFLTCLKHNLWGSKQARFKQWREGDVLAIIADKNLAGIAQVSGRPFKSQSKVWENGVFPNRIPLKFTHILAPKDRPPVLGEIRDVLTQQWGSNYGVGILNQTVLESPNSNIIANAITSRPNALAEYQDNLEVRREEARIKRDLSFKKPSRKILPRVESLFDKTEDDNGISKKNSSEHTKAQSELVTLGKITGCSIWVASNDKGKSFAGKALADDCIKKLPRMGLSDEATKRISLIDVIWIHQNAPACAFEIETSTSIYSGLLRMSDLLSVVTALKIQIYIVAPKERQNKVLSELGRPTFRKIGLSDYCRYISCEDLAELVARVKDFGGDIRPSILDKIAIPLEDEDEHDSP